MAAMDILKPIGVIFGIVGLATLLVKVVLIVGDVLIVVGKNIFMNVMPLVVL